jgi:hypothetical protein
MGKVSASTGVASGLRGRLEVWTLPADQELDLEALGEPTWEARNLVVNSASDVIVGLLRGNVADYLPTYISVGSGGDLDQSSGLDTGARVGPAITDTGMRSTVARIPITTTEDGAYSNEWSYVAVARPHEAISPLLNEFGVESADGTLISHFVAAEDATGRATRYCKTSLEYLVIRWTYTFAVATSEFGLLQDVDSGTYLVINEDGEEVFTLRASQNPGANTFLSFLATITTGAPGTIDLQSDKTVISQSADGTSASIDTQDIV